MGKRADRQRKETGDKERRAADNESREGGKREKAPPGVMYLENDQIS